jgi:hypothetical protein
MHRILISPVTYGYETWSLKLREESLILNEKCKWLKVKIMSLRLTKHNAMKTYWENGGTSLTSALEGGDWSASRSDCFTPGKKSGSHWTGGWVGHRASLYIIL